MAAGGLNSQSYEEQIVAAAKVNSQDISFFRGGEKLQQPSTWQIGKTEFSMKVFLKNPMLRAELNAKISEE